MARSIFLSLAIILIIPLLAQFTLLMKFFFIIMVMNIIEIEIFNQVEVSKLMGYKEIGIGIL